MATTTYHYPYTDADEALKRAVWSKGAPIPNYDANVWRRDVCGTAMKYTDHGAETEYGWEIDHIRPLAKGGADSLGNLQPLHWKNNRRKSDSFPWTP